MSENILKERERERHCIKNEVFQFFADLVTFTVEILNEKLFLCGDRTFFNLWWYCTIMKIMQAILLSMIKNYTIDKESITIANLGPNITEGQPLSTNGFICGK